MDPADRRQKEIDEKIHALIDACEGGELPFSSLGTPCMGRDQATREIIGLGEEAVEPLLAQLPLAGPHAAACIAFCLGELGDRRAIRPLQEALARCEAKTEKGSYDFALIGNARAAL